MVGQVNTFLSELEYILFTKQMLCINIPLSIFLALSGLIMIERTLFSPDHESFRDSFRRFLEKEVIPFMPSGKSRVMWRARSGTRLVKTAFCA
jgi:hypothetical protein